MALPKKHRLNLSREHIALLRKRGKRIVNPFLTAFYTLGETTNSRCSVIVGTSVSKKATERNRLRRLFHEAIRQDLPTSRSIDVLIYPKKTLLEKNFNAVKEQIGYLVKRIDYGQNSYQ